MAFYKFRVIRFILKQRFHPLNLKLHLDAAGKVGNQFAQFHDRLFLGVHGGAYGREQMGVIWSNDLLPA